MSIVEQVAPIEVLTETEQRARTLEAAALEIEVRGWSKGSGEDVNGRVCILGAIAHALGQPKWARDDVEDPKDPATGWLACAAVFGGSWSDIATYNDLEAHSAKEVTTRLRKRAAILRRSI